MKKLLCLLSAFALFTSPAAEWRNLDAEHHLGGRRTSAGYLKGKVVCVIRWQGCGEESAALVKRAEEIWTSFKGKQFVLLGSCQPGEGGDCAAVRDWVKDMGVSFPVYAAADLEGVSPPFEEAPHYVTDLTGKRVYRGSDDRTATQVIVSSLTDLDAPRDVRQWRRFLDYELEHLPGHAYLRLNAFRQKHPKDAAPYREKARELLSVPDVKKVADLVAFAKRAKDPPSFSLKQKAKRSKFEKLVSGMLEKCAPLKEVADPRLCQEAKNSLADLAWTKASF